MVGDLPGSMSRLEGIAAARAERDRTATIARHNGEAVFSQDDMQAITPPIAGP